MSQRIRTGPRLPHRAPTRNSDQMPPSNPFELLGEVDSTDVDHVVPSVVLTKPAAVQQKDQKEQQKKAGSDAKTAGDSKKREYNNNSNVPGSAGRGNRPPRDNNSSAAPQQRRNYTPRDPTQTSDIARPEDLQEGSARAGDRPAYRARDAHHRGDRKPRASYPGSASGAPRGNRREHDRRSGTGREDGDKKDLDREPVAAEVEGQADAEAEVAVENGDAAVSAEAVVPAEPEEKQLTLEQYLAQVSSTKLAAASKARVANEGVDEKQWKGMAVFEKEEEVLFAGKAPKGKKAKEAKEGKVAFEIEVKFADETPAYRPREERGDRVSRGGRGGARGGYTAGRGGRGGAAASARVNIADTTAFPSLGSK
ncbi:hypothetical protein HDU84_002554 [Entophlyctis sp. JEL0112]|nr:hypothetical protein HDU84_002554 [Entophlyctis sp. JEL0112]